MPGAPGGADAFGLGSPNYLELRLQVVVPDLTNLSRVGWEAGRGGLDVRTRRDGCSSRAVAGSGNNGRRGSTLSSRPQHLPAGNDARFPLG